MPPRPFSWNICCSPERPPTCGLSTYPMIAERAPHAGWTELNRRAQLLPSLHRSVP